MQTRKVDHRFEIKTVDFEAGDETRTRDIYLGKVDHKFEFKIGILISTRPA